MSREWELGAAAFVTWPSTSGWEKAFHVACGEWVTETGMSLTNPEIVRALVVIDPEDRKQVRGVLECYGRQFTNWTPELDSNVTRLQAALREFANPTPPKPDEPTGLGAVVESSIGDRWTRIDAGTPSRRWVCEADDSAEPRRWVDFSAVRVLSEGIA